MIISVNAGCIFEEIQVKMSDTEPLNKVLFWNMGFFLLFTFFFAMAFGVVKDFYHIIKTERSICWKIGIISVVNTLSQFLLASLKKVFFFFLYL
jgi:hypothetical protein